MSLAALVISEEVRGDRGCEETCLATPTLGADEICSVDMMLVDGYTPIGMGICRGRCNFAGEKGQNQSSVQTTNEITEQQRRVHEGEGMKEGDLLYQ